MHGWMVLKWISSLGTAEGWEAMSPTLFAAAYHGVNHLLARHFDRKRAKNNLVSYAG
jgi:hypothetical protein